MGKTRPPTLLMGRYELGAELGKGSFAKVYRARRADTGDEVAIKVMSKARLATLGAAQHQVMREIDAMRRVRHPHVVRIHEVMATKTTIFVVMELVAGGSLAARLSPRGVREPHARRCFQQLVSALAHCHALGVFHRDVKPENILLDAATGAVKVADFGLSALADGAREDALLHTLCGTPGFIAPEAFLGRGYDGAKADVWACGVVLFALVAGRFPFGSTVGGMIRRSNYHCPEWFSAGLVRLLRKLLCPCPARRATIPQIMEDPWFKKGYEEIIPHCIGEPEQIDDSDSDDSDDDDDHSTTVSGTCTSSSEGPASPMGSDIGMHASSSAPSLTALESAAAAVHGHMRRTKSLNAFDIIASSPSLDLSGLFQEPSEQMRFVSALPVPTIISKLEDIAGQVVFTARTKEYQVSVEETTDGNKKSVLLVSAKIFQLTPELVMVKVCKKAGDSGQYRRFCDDELKPGLCGLIDGLPEVNAAECMASNSG